MIIKARQHQFPDLEITQGNYTDPVIQAYLKAKKCAIKIEDEQIVLESLEKINFDDFIEWAVDYTSNEYANDQTDEKKLRFDSYLEKLNEKALKLKDTNPKKAIQLFELGIENQNADAWFHLAICYRDGVGGQKDMKKYEEYFNQAIQQNSPKAIEEKGKIDLHNLAVQVLEHKKGVRPEWFPQSEKITTPPKEEQQQNSSAEEQKELLAFAQKALNLENKKTVQPSIAQQEKKQQTGLTEQEAKELFSKVLQSFKQKEYQGGFNSLKVIADQTKDGIAQFCLSLCYKNGYGTEKNSKLAETYARKAQQNGYQKNDPQILMFDRLFKEEKHNVNAKVTLPIASPKK